MTKLIIAAIFALILIGVSIRANALFRNEARLPMQWSFSGGVNWTAPRLVALSFTPVLAIGILVLSALGMIHSTPRPGQEGLELPVLTVIGTGFVAVHLFHIWLIGKTLHRNSS